MCVFEPPDRSNNFPGVPPAWFHDWRDDFDEEG